MSDDHIPSLRDSVNVRGLDGDAQLKVSSTLTSDRSATNGVKHGNDLVDAVPVKDSHVGDRVVVDLMRGGTKVDTATATVTKAGTSTVNVTFPGAAKYLDAPGDDVTFSEHLMTSTTASGYDPNATSWEVPGAVGAFASMALMLGAIFAFVRRSERRRSDVIAVASLAEPEPVYDTAKRDALRAEFAALCDDWLSYDRDVSKLLTRPAMRNYERSATAKAAETMIEAQKLTDAVHPDLETYSRAVAAFRRAMSEAEYDASVDAMRSMSEHERADLERARAALAIALDGGATVPERKSAYRLVSIIMRDLGVSLSSQTDERVMAQIEGSSHPLAQIEARLRSDGVLDSLDGMSRGERAVFVSTRVRHAGQDEVTALTSVLARTASDFTSTAHGSTPVALSKNYADIDAARAAVREVVLRLTPMTEPDVADDVRGAAAARLVELGEALRNADSALAVSAVASH